MRPRQTLRFASSSAPMTSLTSTLSARRTAAAGGHVLVNVALPHLRRRRRGKEGVEEELAVMAVTSVERDSATRPAWHDTS